MTDVQKDNWKTVVIAVAVAAIAAVPPTIIAWASLDKSTETHNLVNSRMTEMLQVVKEAAAAKAVLKEKADERARQGAAAEVELSKLPNRIAHEEPAAKGAPR